MKQAKKRFLSWLLVLCMVLGMVPASVIPTFAADAPQTQAASAGVTLGGSVTEHTLETSDSSPYTITTPGTYRVQGQSPQPIIITADAGEVILVLNGAEIRSATSPIQLQAGDWGAAAKVTLVVADGTTNTLVCTAADAVTAAGDTVQGKTAGINVPEGTTLTIDKIADEEGTGTLTVTAGYGGAGIGGNMGYGYGEEKAPDGAKGGDSTGVSVKYPVSTQYGSAKRDGVSGGAGGIGGRKGTDAETTGTVTIHSGVVTVTGGYGAAGIGGGMGGLGEPGAVGTTGTKGTNDSGIKDGSYFMRFNGIAGGAGGQGGTGGTGGRGGSSGAVSITGGTISVTGGTNAAGIGGGNGGDAGNGGNGGNGGEGGMNSFDRPLDNYGTASYAGAGGEAGTAGFGGNGGNGGNAGTTTITGGAVTITGAAATGAGKKGSQGTDGQPGAAGAKGALMGGIAEGYEEKRSYRDLRIYPAVNSVPGTAASIERPENTSVAGTAAEVKITNSDANIDFTDTEGTFVRPKDVNGVELYKTTFTVREKTTNNIVPGAVIEIHVSGDTDYNYKTVTNNTGVGIVWLPVGSYPITGTVIQKDGIGSVTTESAQTLQVTDTDDKVLTIYIGGGIKMSLSNSEKTYEAIQVNTDITDVQGTVQSVQWFREKINGNDQKYDKIADPGAGVKAFDTGYGEAGTSDKGAATTAAGNDKVYVIDANQNGRYWVQVKYTKNGRNEEIIQSIEVTNIYTKFPIQVNSYVLDKGKRQNETGYQALQLADGTESKVNYGFAWDLNGYNAAALDGTKLLSADVAPYDTVSIQALSQRFTWYNAKIENSNRAFEASSTGGYAPVELTLNPDFLDTNKNLDCDNKDVSKYTIVYTAKAGALTVVEVSGVDKAATDGTTLYSNPRTYTDAITEDTLVAQKLKGYKLTGVKIITADGRETNGTLITEQDGSSAVKIANIQGTVDNEYNDTIAQVRFIYEDNMTNVTIRAYYKDTTNKVESFTEYTVPMEVGTTVTYAAPQIDNHNSVGSSLADDGTYTVVEGGEIIFYYVKATGNVTYKAVLDGTDKVLWSKTGKVNNGAAPETETEGTLPSDAEATGFSLLYERKAGDQAQLSSATYDGVNDIEVTYTYVNKQVEITVRQIDVATMQPVAGTTEVKELKNVGEAATVTAPATPEGYTLLGGAQQLVNVPTDGTPVVVDFYYKASEQATITIKLYGSAEDKTAGNAFNVLTLTGYYGVTQTVTAPTVLGWELADGEAQTIDVTPTKGDDTSLVAEFVYEPVYVTVTVKYVEKDLNAPLGEQTYQVQRGQGLSVVAPYVKGYKLAEGEAAAWNPTAKELETTPDYTFKYSKLDADDLVKITVKGVGPNNSDLYSYEKLVPVGAPDQKVAAFTQPKLALASATVDGVDATISDAKEVTVSLENKAAKDEIVVVFTYKSNMAKVTINAKLNEDKNTPVPGYTAIEVNAEIGDVLTYTAPAIEGYVYVGRTQEQGLTVTGVAAQDVIDFYYEAAPVMGNVTYVAVDKEDPNNILAYGKGVQLVKGEIVDVDTAKGIDHFFSAGVTNWEWTNEDPTVDGADAEGKYDGKTNVTVTFKFQRGTKAININLMDADTGEKITVAGKTYSQIVSKGVETEITAPTDVEGYTPIPNQTVKITAADNAVEETVTFFYRKNDNTASVTVQLCYIDPETNTEKLFNSYTIPGVLGTTRTVTAPDLSGQGFSNPDKSEATVTFEANTPMVKFVYQTVEHKTITVELKSGENTLTDQVTGLKTRYVLRKGEGLTVNAPSIYGYALEDGKPQVISKTYDELTDNEVITINYKKVEVDFVKITVIGKVEGAATNLYSYETSVAVDAGSAELNVYDWPQYKVKDGKAALTGGAAGDTELTIANNKVTVNFNDADRSLTVTVTYVKNTASVTVKAHLFVNNTQTDVPVDGFNAITFEAVIGEEATYTPPSLPGYAYKASSMTDNKITVTGTNDTIIFYYAKSEGQVTYKAVDQDGNDLGYSYSEKLAADTVVETDGKAPTVPNYRLDDTAQVKVEGATADNKFDGSNPVTVTYTFKKFTKTVKIILMDDATHIKITEVDSAAYEAGAAVMIPAPDISAIEAMKGYKRVSAESQERFIMDNDHPQSVTFYYAVEDEARPKVTVNLKDEKGNLIHAYTVTGDWGVDMTIAVPDLSGQGYEYTNVGETSVIVTPQKDDETSLVKDLTYNTQYWTIKVSIKPDGASNLLTGSDYARTYEVRRNSSFTLTAPSIAGYTLTSGNLNKVWDKVIGNETVEFAYDLADAVTNSVHTIVGKTNDGKQLYKFTQTVTKNEAKTTYTATPIDGYTVNQETVELSNNSNQNFEFIYTDNAATVTVIPVDELGAEITGASVTYSGYQKGQQGVKVRAPHVDGKVLVGPWNDTTSAVDGTNLIQTINLSATERNNVVKFAYKDLTANYTFTLYCAEHDGVVIRVIEGSDGEWSVADGGKLNLTADGFVFDSQHVSNSDQFKMENASITIPNSDETPNYKLYYNHIKQDLEYKFVDGEGNEIPGTDTVTNPNPTVWDVNENLVVAAPEIPGYTAKQLRQSLTVVKQADGTKQTITFQYIKKATGTITVEHKLVGADAPFSSYTVSVSDGEWFTANALTDAKYELVGENTRTIQANSGESKTVTFEYNKNFVTVNTYTNLGTSDEPYESDVEVTKGQNAVLTPPARSRFVLKGIKVVTGTQTIGGENELNVTGYANDKLTLTNLTEDAKVYYYYKPISDVVTENQVTITVVEKYEAYALGGTTYKETKTENDTLSAPYPYGTYAGFKLIGYEIDGVEKNLTENFTGASVDHKTNHTITYRYGLADGSNNVVVPGPDNKLPTEDDVTVKPANPDNKPTVDEDTGTVTLPDGGTVETPKGSVDVPAGTTVDKEGNIKTPDGTVIDPSNPAETNDYYFVHYKANGGVGESHTDYYKKDGGSATLKDVGEFFRYDGYTANGWNTYANGLGTACAKNATVTGQSLTLYAQWIKNTTPSGQYQATIVLKPNGAESGDVTQTIASNDNNPIREKIQANPFSITDWTFKGWLDKNSNYYADEAVIEVAHGASVDLFAQWIKVGADGSITVPGQNGKPGDEDDVTAKPNPNPDPGKDGDLKRDEETGVITVPEGGSAVTKDGEVDMPNGGTVKPDGTITVKQPDSSDIEIKPGENPKDPSDPDKTVYTLTYKSGVADVPDKVVYFTTSVTVAADALTREGYKLGQWLRGADPVAVGTVYDSTAAGFEGSVVLTAKWYKVGDNGEITVPGKDGDIETPADNVTVNPKPGEGGEKPSVDGDGNVTVPDGGSVTTPDGEVVVPGGSKVGPDGTITDPDGKKLYPTDAGDPETPEGYFKVTYKAGESGISGQKDVVQLVKDGTKVVVMGNPFASANKVFIGWKDGQGNVVELTAELDAETTLTAQWKVEGSVVLEWAKGSKVQDGAMDGEYKLIMRGQWATTDSDKTDKTYTIPVLVDGRAAAANELRWYVDAASYKDEFGFTNSVLTGNDIVTVNATTGEITVKNSGIVRIWCESTADPTVKKSVVIIVAGDITKDGRVAMSDINYIYAVNDEEFDIPTFDKDDHTTWYLQELLDLSANGRIEMSDINALWSLVDEDSSI